MRSTKLPSWIERLCGLDARPVAPHVFALEPGELRFAAFAPAGGGLELREIQVEPLAPELWAPAPPGLAPADEGAFAERVAALLERVAAPVRQASLVLPDEWLRCAFIELSELPRRAAERDEVVRFKLRRLVPFRPEELRLATAAAPPLAGQQEPLRRLVGFANESALARLEAAFARHGVELGQITSAGLATGTALLAAADGGDLLLFAVRPGGLSLVGWVGGEPVLFRQKALPGDWDGPTRFEVAVRELRLTRAFLSERLPDLAPPPAVLSAPRDEEDFWAAALAAGLEREPVTLRGRSLRLAGAPPAADWSRLAPLVGAASAEVR